MDIYCLYTPSRASAFITTDAVNANIFTHGKFEELTNLEMRDYLLFGTGFQKVHIEKFTFSLTEAYSLVEFVVNCVVHFGKVHSDSPYFRAVIRWSEIMEWKKLFKDENVLEPDSNNLGRPKFNSLLGLRAYTAKYEDYVSLNILTD